MSQTDVFRESYDKNKIGFFSKQNQKQSKHVKLDRCSGKRCWEITELGAQNQGQNPDHQKYKTLKNCGTNRSRVSPVTLVAPACPVAGNKLPPRHWACPRRQLPLPPRVGGRTCSKAWDIFGYQIVGKKCPTVRGTRRSRLQKQWKYKAFLTAS